MAGKFGGERFAASTAACVLMAIMMKTSDIIIHELQALSSSWPATRSQSNRARRTHKQNSSWPLPNVGAQLTGSGRESLEFAATAAVAVVTSTTTAAIVTESHEMLSVCML